MSLSNLAMGVGRRDDATNRDVVDIIEFVESTWGLNQKLYAVQRIILKAHYGLELDDTTTFKVSDWRRENFLDLTEAGYLKFLHEEGRCNISEVIPGEGRRKMVLAIGRRSGKSFLASCIAAYETYKLISKGHPQGYYGLPDSNVIQLIAVATDKDQAGLLYREVHGHFMNVDYFAPYMANATQSFATFQTPYDIDRFGSAADNPKARFSVRVTFRSCIAKGLRGPGNIMMILDEMAHFTDGGQSSAAEVYNAIAPSTSAFSPKEPDDARVPIGPVEGRIILISSPLGRQGHFYELFQTGMRRGAAAKDWLCIQAPTWEVNPSIPAEEFEGFYAVDPRVFFTEYGAEFSDRTRGWIEDKADLIACVNPSLRPQRRAPARMPHFMGVDVALVGDGTAISIGHMDGDGNVVVDLVDYIKAGEGIYEDQDRLNFDDVANWIYSWTKKFYIEKGMFDQWAGIPLEQALEKRGLKQFESVHHTKILNAQIFRNFKNMMFDKRLQLYDDPEEGKHAPYIAELLTLQEEQHSKYVITVEAPNVQGMHDDMSDALVRMVWLATKHQPKIMAFGNALAKPGQNRVTPQQRAKARRNRKLGGSHPSRQPGLYGRRGGSGGRGGGGRRY
jgi:hypothetical protein